MIKDKIREWLGIEAFEKTTDTRLSIQNAWITTVDGKHDEQHCKLESLTDGAFKEQIKELDLIWEELDRLSGEPKVVPSAKTKNKTKPRAKK